MARSPIPRKVCEKCGAKSWTRDIRCKEKSWGGFYCYGHLQKIVKKQPVKAAPATEDQIYVALYRRKTKQQVDKATWWLAAARQRLAAWARKMKQTEEQIADWERRLATLERRAALPDAEVLAIRERARIASQVQKVRRRLQGKPQGDQPTA